MRIIKPQALGLLSRPFEFRREFWLGVATLAFVPIGEACLLPETAMWPFLAEELPPDLPLDTALPKACAEFLAIAHAFAPGAVAARLVEVGIQLGPVIKTLSVAGDRQISRKGVTEAVPFTTMPIDWAHAFGGKEFADNPLGIGAMPIDGTDGQVFAAPNVVDPKLGREAHRTPSGFSPVDQMWPARARLCGTHDDTWLREDFPGFARDIDWHFFNCAPRDQWLPDGLAGDESYAFKNLHPTQPLLQGQLPGIAPRLFFVRNGLEPDAFEEIPLALTTVWCFPHRERLVLVHHGRARLLEEDAADIACVVLGADPLGSLRPADEFRAVMEKRLDRRSGVIHAMRDADLVPEQWLRPDPALAPRRSAAMEQMRARRRRRAERDLVAQREAMKARGLDPDKYPQLTLPPEQSPPTLEELPEFLAKAEAEAEAQKAKAEAEVAAAKAKAAAGLAAAGVPEEEIQQRLDAKPRGPPAFTATGYRAELEQQATAMRLLGVLTFELEAQLASPEFIAQLEAAEAALRNSYRLGAQFQSPAEALSSDRSAKIRRLVSGDTKAARALYDLHGAKLAGLDLSGLDLSGVCLDGADLTRTSLAGAKLADAVLAHADLTECVLEGADLTGANLGKAQLGGASLRNATLKKAVLAGADLTGASLAGADLEAADLSDAILAGTDFTNVRAVGLLAMKLSLRGLHAPGIVLTSAKFIECDIEGADWTDATLDQAVFLQCNLAGIRLCRAQMRKTVFVQRCNLARANLCGADLSEANLRETALPGVALADAIVEQADFSGADLTDAMLTCVRGAGSRWVAANLHGADLHGADFAQADMARADLRGAYLVGVSGYEANVPRAKLDRDTVRRGMFTKRMRFLPLYQPPESRQA
ncbi:MAG TPA: DUF2169 domain-containing protein [Acetobacteraceae bacterium]|nr:DUF2169 domain-containing protein [Acetobacteraceae bacterium]